MGRHCLHYYIPLLADYKFPNRLHPVSDIGVLNESAWSCKNSPPAPKWSCGKLTFSLILMSSNFSAHQKRSIFALSKHCASPQWTTFDGKIGVITLNYYIQPLADCKDSKINGVFCYLLAFLNQGSKSSKRFSFLLDW